MASGVTAPLINLGPRWRWLVVCTTGKLRPRKESPLPIEYDTGWAAEPVFGALEENELSLNCRESNHGSFAVQPVA